MNLSSPTPTYKPRPRPKETWEKNNPELRASVISLRKQLADERKLGHSIAKRLLEVIDAQAETITNVRQLAIQFMAPKPMPVTK
jgi:hypothetical protein